MLDIAWLDDDKRVLDAYGDALLEEGIIVHPFQLSHVFLADVSTSFEKGIPYPAVVVDHVLLCPQGSWPLPMVPGGEQPFTTENVVRVLRLIDSRLKVTLVTGYDPPPGRLLRLVHGCFIKPVLPARLANHIREQVAATEAVEAILSSSL